MAWATCTWPQDLHHHDRRWEDVLRSIELSLNLRLVALTYATKKVAVLLKLQNIVPLQHPSYCL